MEFNFKDKIAVITGGTAGIGLATAELLGTLGAKVAVCGTGKEKLDKAVGYLESLGIETYGEVCDVASSKAQFDLADHVEEHFKGNIDIWVSNAAIFPLYSIIDTPEELFDQLMDINVKSVYVSGRIAYEKMRQKGGVLIIASSIAGKLSSVGSGMYGATKAAASSMVKTLASELAPYNIRVCGYAPGVIRTDLTVPLIEKFGDSLLGPVALRRYGEASEVAQAIAFLASDYAGFITGTILEIDGGKLSSQNPIKAWKDKDEREGK